MSAHPSGGVSESSPELRLLVLGNIGCGKTSSADTILDQQAPLSLTMSRDIQQRQGFSEGRKVSLVEAPRWYWNKGQMEDSIRKETEKSMMLLAPGPHAILLLIPVSQFTTMEIPVPAELEKLFGSDVLNHTLVLLTCGDYLMGKSVEDYLKKEDPGLTQIIERCNGRYHVINNRRRQDRRQVQLLLDKVDDIVQKSGVLLIKSPEERELEKRTLERKHELMESYRAKREVQRQSITSIFSTDKETKNTESPVEEVRNEQKNTLEDRLDVRQVSSGLYSTPAAEQQMEDRQLSRTPSYSLKSDGAILSQMTETKVEPNLISTFHHKINLTEERAPEVFPTALPHTPVFSSSPSSTFASTPAFAIPPASATSPSSPAPLSTELDKVDDIVQKSGVLLIKSPEERELEKRTLERKHELMESYRAKREVQRQSITSIFSTDKETKNTESPVEEVRNEQKNTLEDRLDVRQVSSGLYSTPAAEQQMEDRQLSRTPSYSLKSDGAILSQMTETKVEPKLISTFHHKINLTKESAPEVFPTALPHTPVFSSSPSSTFASTPAFAIPPASATSPSSPAPLSTELRLVLVGRSGSGKSEAGNCILSQEVFRSEKDTLIAVTQECEKKKAEVLRRKVAVVDTPDWFNSERTLDEVRTQISSCIALSSPGPHAFLLCVPVDQPAKSELQALKALESVFGTDAVQKYTIPLFTFADRLNESGKTGKKSVEAYISSERPDLLKLVEVCRDRFHVMKRVKEESNVAELLEKVEQTVKEAGGQCYSSPAFQEVENKVRQRQVEIAREHRGLIQECHKQGDLRQLNSERRALFSYMQPLKEEEVSEDEIEKTRDEAEMSVSTMNIESLPQILLSSISPSLLQSVRERMETSVKMLPQLLADSSTWVSKGAEAVKNSTMWETVGSGAQNVQKMVLDSSVWAKKGASTEHSSKMVGDGIPKVAEDGSACVESGAKAATTSPMWEKVGSGAQLLANGSMHIGAGIGTRAINLAQSPVWGQMGSGVKTGAKTVVESPVWGKVGSGAKAGAKMVAESPVWERIAHTAKQVPKVVIGGAVLGLVIGVFFGGVIGGALGAAAGSAVTEVGRRKIGNKSTLEKTEGSAKNVEKSVRDSVNSQVKTEKVLKVD